jgi:anti-sigma B factor antagonist
LVLPGEGMTIPFKLHIEQRDSSLVVAVTGDLDLSTAHLLDDALERAKTRYSARIVVDLAETEFIDSSGLRVLIKHAYLEPGGHPVRLANCPAQAQRLFEVSGVLGKLALAATN